MLKETRQAAVLFSGGKDSTRAIQEIRSLGVKVVCLITLITDNSDSYMLHVPNIRMAELSAKALDLPIVLGTTEGEKELELVDIKRTILSAQRKYDFTVLGSGALASEYQKSRLATITSDIGLDCINPLWGRNQESYMLELAKNNYNFVLTSVSASGLDETWLGKEMDSDAVRDLISLSRKHGFNPALEGGEGETLVLDCPIFPRERIAIFESRKIWNGYTGILNITKAGLVPKESN
jgi:diphthine-ammonia ligase